MSGYRICPNCKTKNPASATRCKHCGNMRLSKEIVFEDTTDTADAITVVNECSDTLEEFANRYVLEAIEDDYRFVLPDGKTTIGRNETMKEYLDGKRYIGRTHAEFLKEQGRLFIRDLNSINHVFVNNNEIPVDEPVELHIGDEIGIGGKVVNGKRQSNAAYFTVKECE